MEKTARVFCIFFLIPSPGSLVDSQVYAGAPGNFTLIEDDGDGDVVGDVLLRRTTFVPGRMEPLIDLMWRIELCKISISSFCM